jgi:hypothetical protein
MTAPDDAVGGAHERVVAREFFAAALYMALVLLAALVTVPQERLPDDSTLVATLVGTAVGLVLAHWLAFRLAAHLTADGGFWMASAAREAGAQVLGGLTVALVAAAPFLVLEGSEALQFSLILLAALPAVTGLAIARLRGLAWVRSVVTAAVVLGLAVLVVVVKSALGH